MPTTFTSLRSKGAAYVGGALTVIGAVALSSTLSVGAITGTTANFSGTMTGARLEVRPSSGSGFLRLRSVPGVTATGAFLCIEDLTGAVDICYSSGGRLDCDTDTRSLCI